MLNRCDWCLKDDLYLEYHDKEWGVPVHDDNKLFEFLILEGAQAGLSWLTVLRKRKTYLEVYDGFDPLIVAQYGEDKVIELLSNSGIIRNRLKIEASIKNARAFLTVQEKFGSFDRYIWDFVNGKSIQNKFSSVKELPAETQISKVISKDLKSRGFSFIGSTIVYAHMQATGMVNDHLVSCFRHQELGGVV